MNMTDYDVLAKFLAIVEVGRLRGPIAGQRDNHKPYWEWRAGKWPEVEAVLHEFYPWLGERRRAKADAAYAQYVWESAAFVTKDACRRGHPLDGPDADVRVTLRGGRKRQRQCRVCARLIAAEQRAQRRAAA